MIKIGLKMVGGGSSAAGEVVLNLDLSQSHLFHYEAPGFAFSHPKVVKHINQNMFLESLYFHNFRI